MIVDIRTRLFTGRDPIGSAGARLKAKPDVDASSDAHRRAMHLVDAAVLVGWRSDRLAVHLPSQHIAAAVNEAPEYRLGFAPVDATADSALDDVDAAVELGMAGLTFCPADQGIRPTDDRALALFERAALRKLPVLVANPCLTAPQSVLEFARPSLLDEAARTVPNLTLVLGDLGQAFQDETLVLIAKHEKVYAEISSVVSRTWALYTTLLNAHERGVMNKLLFASGFPLETPERAIERLYTVNSFRGASGLPGIPREAIRSIVERNALETLSIDAPVAPSRPRSSPTPAPTHSRAL